LYHIRRARRSRYIEKTSRGHDPIIAVKLVGGGLLRMSCDLVGTIEIAPVTPTGSTQSNTKIQISLDKMSVFSD
jgi:hypothetical protein